MLPLLSPEVHNQLLRFVDIEVIFLAPHLLPVSSLLVIKPTTFVKSANLMIK
jgi:hypothetical protein